MLAGVVEEIGEDPLEPARVGLDDHAVIGELEHGVPVVGGRDVPDEAVEVDGLDPDLLARRVEPRQLHQVLDEDAHPPDVLDHELARPAGLRRQRIEVVAEDRHLGDEGRDRRPQLVADVRDEPPVLG